MAKRRAKWAEDVDSDGGDDDQPTEAELVRAEIERVRARLGVDPALPRGWLAGAWSAPSGSFEDDEAEMVDMLADCLSAGLHLGDAVVSWTSGKLARSDDGDDEPELEKESPALAAAILSATQPKARRRITIR